jgi:hypothetical protein
MTVEKKNVVHAALKIRKEEEAITLEKVNDDITQDDSESLEIFKDAMKAAGALTYGRHKLQEMHGDFIVMLNNLKEKCDFSVFGYRDFSDFCEKELNISGSKAYELTKQIKSLGEPTYEALKKIGMGYRDIRALRKGKEQEKIDTEDTGELIVDGETIEIIPQNKDRIKEVIKKIEKEKADFKKSADDEAKLRIEIQEKLNEKTTIRDQNPSDYELECSKFLIQVKSLLGEIQGLHIQAKLSLEKREHFVAMMHAFHGRALTSFDYYVNGIIPAEIIED